MQDSLILGRNQGQEVVWHEIGVGHHWKSKNHQRPDKSHTGQTKKVCVCEEETPQV
jgi:hypothetical protein